MAKSRLSFVTLFVASLAISACDAPTQIEILPQPTEVFIPAQNQTCPLIPPPPNPDAGAKQQQVAAWLPDVYAAHAECRSDLRVAVRTVEAHNEEARRVAAENSAKAAE